MRRNPLPFLLLGVMAPWLAACSTRAVQRPSPEPKTSYRQLDPGNAPHYTLAPGDRAVQPILQKRVLPVYPPALVRTGAAPVMVVVQLVMDKDGKVEAVYPVSDTDHGPQHTLYEAAVEHAAMQWTFTPLWVQHPNRDGTYLQTTKPFSLWYTFRFAVVDGKPEVETAKR